MDIAIGSKSAVERVVFELFSSVTPRTAENFRSLCLGSNAKKLSFKGSKFHRVVPGFVCQGGDITAGDGTGGMSIYGRVSLLVHAAVTRPAHLHHASAL